MSNDRQPPHGDNHSQENIVTNHEPASLTGAFISERAVRGALRSRPATATDADDGARPRRLRRWSVAELLARAIVQSSATSAGH